MYFWTAALYIRVLLRGNNCTRRGNNFKFSFGRVIIENSILAEVFLDWSIIVGPLLFLIYVNDLAEASKIFFFILFADDTNLFLSHADYDSLIRLTNQELEKVITWFETNKLSVNIKKTYYLIFCSKNKSYNKKNANIFLKNLPLSQECQATFLGVLIDDRLTWKPHIAMLLNKISKTIGIIGKIRHLLSQRTFITIYNSLIYPYLMYCNIVWGNAYKTSLHPLLILQKKFLRIATCSSFYTHSSPLFEKLRILNIYDVNRFQLALFTAQHINHTLPDTFDSFLNFRSQFHNYQTRQSTNLHIPLFRTSLAQMSVKYMCVKIWNDLPPSLKNITSSLLTFKRNLKIHLLIHPSPL